MSNNNAGLDIAIIGLAGKFPGANNITEFWELLKNGVEAITHFTDEELRKSGVDPNLLNDPNYIKSRCIIEDEDMFDARFFDFFPREVEMMDPQQRLFLETAWTALEEAGYQADQFDGLIGVFGGVSLNTYLFSYLMGQSGFISSAEGYQLSIGNDKDFLTTRVSYKMNLTGPSVDVQTACSTSLVAVHLACQNLLNYNCDMALAGGVSITIPQKQGYYYQEGMILSKDGHCRAFDENASGTISGSGVGIVVLKRLEEALEDGDHIYGVIKGSAYNNDGSNRVGYTAPSVDGQSEAIANAQSLAGVDADTISYIETHGTGTALGDPIEITALSQVFREQTEQKQFCAIGSVKTNIGHLDAAAGVAGLIKTALSLHHKQIPPSLNFEKPNSKIDFANSPFFVNTALRPWERQGNLPLRCGVSSFGIGGTNVHTVLEEAPPVQPSDPAQGPQLLILSAKSSNALDQASKNLAGYLRANPGVNLADVAFTLQTGRKSLQNRRCLVVESVQEGIEVLQGEHPKRLLSANHSKEPAKPLLAFMFSGQGAQYVNMARQLYELQPFFREQVDTCCDLIQDEIDVDLRELIYPAAGSEANAAEKLNQTGYTQPALFIIEYALARLWMHWGIEPAAMAGHSIGEYVAACLAGVFSLEDALKVVAARGRLMQSMPAGAMISVRADESEINAYLNDQVSLAALNSSGVTVLSGTFDAVESLEAKFKQKKIEFRRLHTSHAFHSAMMDPILDEFRQVVAKVTRNEPQQPYVSNVTGTWITTEEATDPKYYARHLRHTVRFMDNVQTLFGENDMVLLEVGPGTTLSTLARRHPANTLGRTILASLPHPQEDTEAYSYVLNSAGILWMAGLHFNWNVFYEGKRRLRLSLPTYPFERKRFWLENNENRALGGYATAPEQLKKNPDISDWFYSPSWKQYNLPTPGELDPDQPSRWLVFKDRTGLSNNFITYITKTARFVVVVEDGTAFTEKDDHHYALRVEKVEDYHKLFDILTEKDLIPDQIGHFWNISVSHQDDLPIESEHIPGFKSILFLTQALAKRNLTHRIQLGIVTSHLFQITGFEPYKPGKAMVLGLSKVISQEFPNIITKTIDVKLPQGLDDRIIDLARQVAAEFLMHRTDLTVGYRGRQRWVQEFSPLPLISTNVKNGLLKEEGVYIITGGLGRIGLALAGYLSQTVKARLVLIDRMDFPEEKDWNGWLEDHDANEPVSQQIQKLQKIAEDGHTPLILKADVANEEEVKQVISRAAETFNDIDGVIHAAGIVGTHAFKSINEITEEDWQSQFHAKVKGAQNLALALQDHTPDFVLLQSSLSAVLGGLGFGAYAAANAFLDGVSYQQNLQESTQWISVNWDGWNFDEDAIDDTTPGAEIARLALTPDEGIAAFERIFSHQGLTQIVVSSGNLQQRIDKWVKLSALHETENSPEKTSDGLHSRPDLPVAYNPPETELQEQVTVIWQKLLGIEPIGLYDDFFDLGGNSLMGTQLISQLRESFQVELPLRSLFEDPTVSGVSKIIDDERSSSESAERSKVADMLKQMEEMSDEQAAELLKNKKDQSKK